MSRLTSLSLAFLALLLLSTACRSNGGDEHRNTMELAIASAGQGVAPATTDNEDLAAQIAEGYAARGRALGEGHASDEPVATAAAPSDTEPAPGDVEEDEEDKDYWKDVEFTRSSFEEVRRFVREHYIDDEIDEKRALIEAVNFALLSVEPPLEMLPRSFYELRRGHPDEEGRLDGEIVPLSHRRDIVVHVIPDKERPRRRLTDDQIRQLRLRDKARFALLERHWRELSFNEGDFSKFLDQALKRRDTEKQRPADLFIAAAQGYLYSLDPHSSLVSASAWDESTRQTEDASFDGIGAVLTQRDGRTIVESPIEGQPALAAGLRAGDVILLVDGKEIFDEPLFKVVKRIRGPKGTKVTLRVQRVGVPEDFDITITRAHIDIKNVSGHLMQAPYEDVGYVKMTGFIRSSSATLDAQIEDLRRQTSGGELRGLIFDLRNDTGGLLSQAIEVADKFVSSGVIVSVRNRAGGMFGSAASGETRDEVYRASPLTTVECPVVVLVNDGTASAAEIVASALQENRRALVIGDRTFGKASVQTLYPPPGDRGYYIKLTVARYYSPMGRTLQLTGVKPDMLVPPEVGGDMPLGFREENLRNPLPPEDAHYRSPMAALIPALDPCVQREGQAEALHASDPNPAVKFDYQLMKAADYLECLIDLGPNAGSPVRVNRPK